MGDDALAFANFTSSGWSTRRTAQQPRMPMDNGHPPAVGKLKVL